MSLSNYLEAAWLNSIRGGGAGASFTAPSAVYLQLHTADPGENGTANVASNNTRQTVAFNAESNPAGTMVTSGVVTWTSVPASETYAYWSLWDASTAGNCLWYGALSAPAVMTTGDTFQVSSLTVALD